VAGFRESRRGNHSCAEQADDIREVVAAYSRQNGYAAEHFANATCACGGTAFELVLDDDEGAAVRTCSSCGCEHPIGDSEEYLEDAELEECECPCGAATFEITVGVSLYPDSEDVRWLYLGCRCPSCGLTAVYGDWKNEFIGYRGLLALV
jgi:hypothetical protein